MNKLHSNNRGLTLVELIVVVAILGIVSVGSIGAIGLLHSTSAKETTTKLNSALSKARTESMSRAQASMKLYAEDSSYYVQYTINNKEEPPIKIGNSRVTITYTDTNGMTYEINENAVGENAALNTKESIVIEFNRETGGFKPISGTNYCKKFAVTSAGKSYELECQKLTGKIVMK